MLYEGIIEKDFSSREYKEKSGSVEYLSFVRVWDREIASHIQH